ncbi:hypothetical protein [Congregibacter sp.]|uniref:hypothetical protein n=1 Tax=Congregibacter sp. TaxID=2744308 RepID=UPI003F6A66B2
MKKTASINERTELRCEEVETLLAEQGCKGRDLRLLVKFHEIRARLNLGNAPAKTLD